MSRELYFVYNWRVPVENISNWEKRTMPHTLVMVATLPCAGRSNYLNYLIITKDMFKRILEQRIVVIKYSVLYFLQLINFEYTRFRNTSNLKYFMIFYMNKIINSDLIVFKQKNLLAHFQNY